jgi:hypothetical protein
MVYHQGTSTPKRITCTQRDSQHGIADRNVLTVGGPAGEAGGFKSDNLTSLRHKKGRTREERVPLLP